MLALQLFLISYPRLTLIYFKTRSLVFLNECMWTKTLKHDFPITIEVLPGEYLFSFSPEINWLVTLIPKNRKFDLYVPQFCLCYLVPLKVWPLFPCSPETNALFLWEGLTIEISHNTDLIFLTMLDHWSLSLSANVALIGLQAHFSQKSDGLVYWECFRWDNLNMAILSMSHDQKLLKSLSLELMRYHLWSWY